MLAAPCAVVLLMCAGCNNDEIPQWEPTATGDGSDDGTETGTDGGEPVPDPCWEPGGNFDPANPTLYQCVGEGSGELEFIICKNPFGCTASVAGVCDYDDVAEWTKMEPTVGPFTFPPTPPATEPDSQACCEYDATAPQIEDGCKSDCAVGACNQALAELEQELANHEDEPETGCGELTACYDRVVTGLTTWIDYLEANFDDCVRSAAKGDPFYFPNPEGDVALGALACATLQIDCSADPVTAPYDLEESCSVSENEPDAAAGALILECDLDGEVEVSDAAGSDFSTLAGTAIIRRESPCIGDSCWFSIDSLELDADSFSDYGYIGRGMHASLAYPGFGQADATTDDGTIAHRMFGLDVTLDGKTPSTSLQSYGFRMSNSDSAVFEVSTNQFQIVDAWFGWDDYDVVITTDLTTCTCLNCS